jgi:hypothetical protein
MTTMNNKHNFPALCFLFLAWLAIANITGIIILAWKLPQLMFTGKPPQQTVRASTLASIFDEVGTVVPSQVQPELITVASTRRKKSRASIPDLIQSEATRKVS